MIMKKNVLVSCENNETTDFFAITKIFSQAGAEEYGKKNGGGGLKFCIKTIFFGRL
jgi:hypothetical protein